LKLQYDETLSNFAFEFNLRRCDEVMAFSGADLLVVGRCRLILSKFYSKGRLVSEIETKT
jgi:hypothetical protein